MLIMSILKSWDGCHSTSSCWCWLCRRAFFRFDLIWLRLDDISNWGTDSFETIECEDDQLTLQLDINYLHDWSVLNKMKFHPSKCKVLMVSKHPPPFLNILPFIQFQYTKSDKILDYVDSDKDLGIDMNRTLNFRDHAMCL